MSLLIKFSKNKHMLSTDSSTKQLSGVITHHTAKDLTYVYRSQHDDE